MLHEWYRESAAELDQQLGNALISIDRYPPFPESIAFNNDRKKSGIACHHPKLIVLQREDQLRVVITSANLVAKQVIISFFMHVILLLGKDMFIFQL